MNRILVFALAIAALTLGANAPSRAAPATSYNVGVCDPGFPDRCFAPAANFTNITTATNTVIKATPGTFKGLVVNTGGASSVATVYNNTTCTGAKIGIFSTATQTSIQVNAWASVGICVTTGTGTPADITVLWR